MEFACHVCVRGVGGGVAGMCSWPARQLETPPSAVVAEGIVLSSVVRC